MKVSGKLLVSFFQIATKVPTVYQVRMPPACSSSSPRSSASTSSGCRGDASASAPFFNRCSRSSSRRSCDHLPLPVSFHRSSVSATAARARQHRWRRKLASCRGCRATFLRALPGVGLISFLAFPVVSSYAFKAFDCECFEDGRSYLRADYSLMCSTSCVMPSRLMLFETNATGAYTDEYWRVQYLARTAIVFYPLGVPIFYLVLLLAVRRRAARAQDAADQGARLPARRLRAALLLVGDPRGGGQEARARRLRGDHRPGTVYQLVMAMMVSLLFHFSLPSPSSDVHDFDVLLPVWRVPLVDHPQAGGCRREKGCCRPRYRRRSNSTMILPSG